MVKSLFGVIRCGFGRDYDVDGLDLAIFSSNFGKNFK